VTIHVIKKTISGQVKHIRLFSNGKIFQKYRPNRHTILNVFIRGYVAPYPSELGVVDDTIMLHHDGNLISVFNI